MDIATFLTTQWNALLANPGAFIACAAASGGAGFAAAKLFYSTQAEVAKVRLEAARDDLARLEKDRSSRDAELAHVKAEVTALRADIDRAPRITVGPKPPTNPRPGDLFIETEEPLEPGVPGADLFIIPPQGSLSEARSRAQGSGKPLFIVIYDPSHPTRSKLAFTLGYFLEYETTRKLVAEHFEAAVVPSTDADAKALVPQDDPLEKPRWVVLLPNGRVLRSEGLYANSDEGMKRTREAVAAAEAAK